MEFVQLLEKDIDRNFLEILNQLDWTNKTKDMPIERAKLLYGCQRSYGRETYGLKLDDELIAIGSIIINPSIIHSYKYVAMIEDVAVRKDKCGLGYGKILMENIKEIIKNDAYKAILSCSDHNIKFYKKCGYTASCMTMRLDLE